MQSLRFSLIGLTLCSAAFAAAQDISPEQNKLYDDYIKELEERDTRRRDRRD